MKVSEWEWVLGQMVDPSHPRNFDDEQRKLLGFGREHYPYESRDDTRDSAIRLIAEVLTDAAAREER